MKVTAYEQLILGIVAEQPRHGYEIEKIIVQRGTRKWADIGFSSIYYVLDKLESKELIHAVPTVGKEKKQYTVTDKGITELIGNAKELIAERKPANTHIMLGLAASDFLDKAAVAELLETRKATLISDLKVLLATQKAATRLPDSAARMFGLSRALVEAEIRWITEEIERTNT